MGIRYSYKFNVMVRGVQLFCSRSEQFQQICIESIDPSTKVDFVWPPRYCLRSVVFLRVIKDISRLRISIGVADCNLARAGSCYNDRDFWTIVIFDR